MTYKIFYNKKKIKKKYFFTTINLLSFWFIPLIILSLIELNMISLFKVLILLINSFNWFWVGLLLIPETSKTSSIIRFSYSLNKKK